MSKAEDRAFECFPNKDIESKTARFGFLLGYYQARKDMKLTWKDIANILDVTDIIANDDSMEERLKKMSEEEYCQEVLKRFKERKKNNYD